MYPSSGSSAKKNVKLVLGTFARSGIEACLGRDIEAGVEAALRYYSQTRGRQVEPLSLAGDCAGEQGAHGGEELDLELDPEVEDLFESEARRADRVPVEQLGAHAILAYLADLDRSGAEVLQAPVRS